MDPAEEEGDGAGAAAAAGARQQQVPQQQQQQQRRQVPAGAGLGLLDHLAEGNLDAMDGLVRTFKIYISLYIYSGFPFA